MRGSRMVWLVLMVVTFAVSPVVALAASQTYGKSGKSEMIDYRSMQGKVSALDVTSKVIQVMPTDGSMPGPVRVRLGGQTAIHQGILQRTLANLKIGEDVTLRYSGTGNKWFADSINILNPSVSVARNFGSR